VTDELATIIDFIRFGTSRFAAAGLSFGHSNHTALDEASHLVLSGLHLPPDLPPAHGGARLTAEERAHVLELIRRRVDERVPAAYLVGETWFAGLRFKCDARALVPRSPIAELIENGFSPLLDGREVEHALDLCTGSGCIGIAMAVYHPHWQVDLTDISAEALSLAAENMAYHHVGERVRALRSDLFEDLEDTRYDLIVSNPPYVGEDEYAALPGEYGHEPKLGLTSGEDGLDFCLRLLDQAADHLSEDGVLIVEVGNSEHALMTLLPDVPFVWLEFQTGPMGIFALQREDLVEHADAIRKAATTRTA
jgi:ribosomal protein L3 glutamine methyltransferase